MTKCSADGRCPTTPATTNIPPSQPTNPDSCPEEFPEYGVCCVVLTNLISLTSFHNRVLVKLLSGVCLVVMEQKNAVVKSSIPLLLAAMALNGHGHFQ